MAAGQQIKGEQEDLKPQGRQLASTVALSLSPPLSFSACVGLKCSRGSNPLIFVTVISGLMALI